MRRLALLLLALAAPLVAPSTARSAIVDRVAAVVNEDVITLSEVYDLGGQFIEQQGADPAARRAAELEVLDSLILRRLISQEVERLGLEVSDQELERAIEDIARRNGLTREQLRQEVERSGLPWTEYRTELTEGLRQAKFNQMVMQPRITVDEDELKDAYRRLITSAEMPQLVELGAIFVAAPPAPAVDVASLPPDQQAAAQAIIARREQAQQKIASAQQRIAGGEPFASVATALDEGPYGASGGRMGTYRQGELTAILDAPAFAVPVGQLSEPIATEQGFFLLYVFDRYPEKPPEFETVRDQLFEQVYSVRIQEETEVWYQQALRHSAVVIKLEEVK